MNGNRKFFLATFASFSATILCWYHCLNGVDWTTAQGIILGLYKAANVVDKKLGGAG